ERGEGGRGPGERSSAPSATRKMDEILFHPETSTRRALILVSRVRNSLANLDKSTILSYNYLSEIYDEALARGTPMNHARRPKAPPCLSDDDRQKPETWASRPKSPQRLATRARIILACAAGLDNNQVAARLRINRVTVGKWRGRFVEDRLEGLA